MLQSLKAYGYCIWEVYTLYLYILSCFTQSFFMLPCYMYSGIEEKGFDKSAEYVFRWKNCSGKYT